MSDRDVDAEFADIVAHWDEVESLPDGAEAVEGEAVDREAVERDGVDRDGLERNPVNPPLTPGPSPTNPAPTGPFVVWRGAEQARPAEHQDDQEAPDHVELLDSDDEHFEPGPTAPLPPQEDISFWGIIVGLVAGPLLLLWLVLFRPGVSGWWTLGALGMTIGGFVLLVMRQPHARDDTDPDNGARV